MDRGQCVQAAVCVVRVEVEPSRTLITVTDSGNLDRALYSARARPPLHFLDPKDALSAVADFLTALAG